MTVRIEQNPITEIPEYVIDGFQGGVSDNPESGISDMRNINNEAIPGIAMCDYALKQVSNTFVTGTITGVDQVLYTVTLSSPVTFGMPIRFAGSLPTGLTAGLIYYAMGTFGSPNATSGTVTSLTLTLQPPTTVTSGNTLGYGTKVAITSGTTGGTFTTSPANLGSVVAKPTAYAIDLLRNGQSFNYYILDNVGQIWTNMVAGRIGQPGSQESSNGLIFTLLKAGGTNGQPWASSSGNGICFWKNYLCVFTDNDAYFYDAYGYFATPNTWTAGFPLLALSGSKTSHPAIWSQNDSMYYGDGNYLGSFYDNNYTLTATGTIAAGATTATLTTAFGGTGGVYEINFSDGEIRLVTFTEESTSISWTGALVNTVSANLIFSIQPSAIVDDAGGTTLGQNTNALQLPIYEQISALAEPSIDSSPGNYIYIGSSTSNNIYPWNKTTIAITLATGVQQLSTAYDAPLVVPEVGCYQMLNINKIVYILQGQQGNVYYTNQSSIQHFTQVPAQPTKNPYSLFSWGGIMSLDNNLVFGVADQTSTGGTQNNASGAWAVKLSLGQLLNVVAGAIRYYGQPSGGVYIPTVLIPTTNGLTYYAAWYNGTSGGIDILDNATPTFYSYPTLNGTPPGSYLETDIVHIGTAYNPKTLSNVEASLDTALVASEKFRISMRNNLSDTYTLCFEQTTTGALFGKSDSGLPEQALQWVQFKAELQTVSGGSFTRLKEIRFH